MENKLEMLKKHTALIKHVRAQSQYLKTLSFLQVHLYRNDYPKCNFKVTF